MPRSFYSYRVVARLLGKVGAQYVEKKAALSRRLFPHSKNDGSVVFDSMHLRQHRVSHEDDLLVSGHGHVVAFADIMGIAHVAVLAEPALNLAVPAHLQDHAVTAG